jgi:hypothetical protein
LSLVVELTYLIAGNGHFLKIIISMFSHVLNLC